MALTLLTAPLALAQENFGIRRVGGVYNCWADVVQIEARNHYLLIDEYSYAGLQIMDISDPANPEIVNEIRTFRGYEMFLDGDRLYSNPPNGDSMRIYDISELPEVSKTSTFRLPAMREGVVGNRVLYSCEGKSVGFESFLALQARNLSDPENPQEFDYVRCGVPRFMSIRDTLIFCEMQSEVAPNHIRFTIYNVANPDSMYILSQSEPLPRFSALKILDNYAWIVHGDTLVSFDISDPRNPTQTGQLPGCAGSQIDGVGNTLFISGGRVASIDISDPANPTVLDTIYIPGTGAFNGSTLVVTANNYPHLYLIDLTDPTDLRLVGDYWKPARVIDVIPAGQLAYVLFYQGGFGVVDISDPERPTELSFLPFEQANESGNMVKRGDYVYATYIVSHPSQSGLRVINVSDPSHPELIRSDSLGYIRPKDLSIAGNRLYCKSGDGDIKILDISNPDRLQQVATYHYLGYVEQIAVDEQWLYFSQRVGRGDSLAEPRTSLVTLNISDPASPRETSRIALEGGVEDLYCNNSILFALLSTWPRGSIIEYSLSDPSTPVLTYTMAGSNTTDLTGVGEDYLFCGGNVLSAYSLRDEIGRSKPPELVGYFDDPGLCDGLAVQGNYLYVADQLELGVYDISEIVPPEGVTPDNIPTPSGFLFSAYPNPFNAELELRFTLDRPDRVILSLIDPTGRQIALLSEGHYPPGAHMTAVSLPNLPSGQYYAKLAGTRMERVIPISCLR